MECICGSGESSWALKDARGIYVSRVCDKCVEKVKSGFRPEIFDDGSYEADEPIEPEEEIPHYPPGSGEYNDMMYGVDGDF